MKRITKVLQRSVRLYSTLNKVNIQTLTGEAKATISKLGPGANLNIFQYMINSPPAVEAYTSISACLKKTTLAPKEIEVMQLRIGELNGCEYCQAAHTHVGKNSGLTEEQTIEARKGKMEDPKLNALVEFVTAVHETKGKVNADAIEKFKSAGYTDANIVDVCLNFSIAILTNYFNNINQTPVDLPPAKPL